jgi:membrane protein DedA with SNARE-associated domain
LAVPDLLRDVIDALVALPPGAVYTAIGILAAVENIFPPVPADTAVAVGAFLSTAGQISVWMVFGITWTANSASATGVYIAGRTIGRPFFRGRLGRRLLQPRAMARLELAYERHGTWGILLSRFVPGLRAVVPPFAGIAGLGAFRTIAPIVVASGLWYGALTYLAATVIRELQQIVDLISGINRVGLGIAVSAAVAGLATWWRRRRRKSMVEDDGVDGR